MCRQNVRRLLDHVFPPVNTRECQISQRKATGHRCGHASANMCLTRNHLAVAIGTFHKGEPVTPNSVVWTKRMGQSRTELPSPHSWHQLFSQTPHQVNPEPPYLIPVPAGRHMYSHTPATRSSSRNGIPKHPARSSARIPTAHQGVYTTALVRAFLHLGGVLVESNEAITASNTCTSRGRARTVTVFDQSVE